MMQVSTKGFSLIELMVTLVILAILVVLGFPSYEQWIRNTRIRNAAESIQNGLKLARNEASQRGVTVEFYLKTAGTADWSVCQLASATTTPTDCSNDIPIQSFAASGGAATVQVFNSASTAAATTYTSALTSSSTGSVVFNALGRPASYGTKSMLRIDATAAPSDSRRLVVTVSPGGMVRMCDPALAFAATTPQGCK